MVSNWRAAQHSVSLSVTKSVAAVPRFPELAPLSLEHRAVVARATAGAPPYSDQVFASLFAWDIDATAGLAWIDDTLVLRLEDYTSRQPFFTLFGGRSSITAARRLLFLARHGGCDPMLRLVPEPVADTLRRADDLSVRPERDHFDYVLCIERMATLEGSDLHMQRNRIARFERRYGSVAGFRQIEPSPAFARDQLEPLLESWSASKPPPPGELRALRRAFAHAETLDLALYGTFVDGRLVGFSIIEVLGEGWAVVHFEKNERALVGSGFAHRRAVARALRARGCRRLNYEQDLGVPGLRRAKLACRPIDMLRKFTVSLVEHAPPLTEQTP